MLAHIQEQPTRSDLSHHNRISMDIVAQKVVQGQIPRKVSYSCLALAFSRIFFRASSILGKGVSGTLMFCSLRIVLMKSAASLPSRIGVKGFKILNHYNHDVLLRVIIFAPLNGAKFMSPWFNRRNLRTGRPVATVVPMNGRHSSVTIAHRHFFYVPHLEFQLLDL